MKDLLTKEYLHWLRVLDEHMFVLSVAGNHDFTCEDWIDADDRTKSLEDTITCLKAAILFTEVYWNM